MIIAPFSPRGQVRFDREDIARLGATGYLVAAAPSMLRIACVEAYGAWSSAFASDEKRNWTGDPKTPNGYLPIETLGGCEMKESFYCNPWTALPLSVATSTQRLIAALLQVARGIVKTIRAAVADDLVANDQTGCLRVMRYPALAGDAESELMMRLIRNGNLRSPPHTDLNALTILPTPTAPGLEVLGDDGQWRLIDDVPDRVIVQVGQQLEQRSEGRFRAAVHRVRLPLPEEEHTPRLAAALFVS